MLNFYALTHKPPHLTEIQADKSPANFTLAFMHTRTSATCVQREREQDHSLKKKII